MSAYKAFLAVVRNKDHAALSARQMLTLMHICDIPDDNFRTVRALSEHFRIAKAAVTRAADRLGHLELAKRVPAPLDKRSVFIQPTAAGRALVRDFVRECGK